MINPLDSQIARVLAELDKLKRQKLDILRRRMWELERGAATAESPPPKPQARKVTEAEAKKILLDAMDKAGENGISARMAAEQTGISYARVGTMMPQLFKWTGTGRHTLYFPKKKRGK